MAATETRLQVGDIYLNVSIDGDDNKPTLLFLHGLTDSSSTWRWIVPQLSDRYRVVLFDFRGHGRSDRAAPYVTPDFLNDAVAVCEQIAGAGCAVIALSFGGLIATALAQQHPGLVRAVFLEDPLLVDPAVRTDLLDDEDGALISELFGGVEEFFAQVAKWQQEGLSAQEAASKLGSMPTPHGASFSEAWFRDAIVSFAEGKLQFDLQVFDDFAAARQTREAEPVFDPERPIEVPGLLLAGDTSVPGVLTRPIDLERLRAMSPEIDHQIVEGGGHGMHAERGSRGVFMEAITRFLAGLDS